MASEEIHNRRLLKNSAGVAAATLMSRILGLVRVVFEARVLGGGVFASAWFLAFSIPNLFRRILGEGALGTALIPLITQSEAEHGSEKVRRDLSVVFAALSFLLALIVVIVSGGAWLLCRFSRQLGWAFLLQERVQLTLQLLPLLMPYAFFICLVGITGAVLNTRRCFFLPAAGALSLNIFLISGLAVAYCKMSSGALDMRALLNVLGILVLLSGLFQLVFVGILLWRKGFFPELSAGALRNRKVLGELWHLVLPGMIGGAALQASFLVDRFLALYIGPEAVPALTNTDRVIDLPIGIFAISLGAVLMAELSKLAAEKDFSRMAKQMQFSLRQVCFVCVPLALFVMLFREEIFRILLLGGNFTEDNLRETMQAALFYGAGIPVFCSLKVILPMFFARKQMKTPFYVSLFCIGLNVVLNLILMWPLKQGGIALATVIASYANNMILLFILRRQGFEVGMGRLTAAAGRCLAAAGISAAAVCCLPEILFNIRICRIWGEGRMAVFGALLSAGVIFALLYALILFLLGGREIKEVLSLFRRERRVAGA